MFRTTDIPDDIDHLKIVACVATVSKSALKLAWGGAEDSIVQIRLTSPTVNGSITFLKLNGDGSLLTFHTFI